MEQTNHISDVGQPEHPPTTAPQFTEPPKLTTKQKLFVEYYLADANGVKAARRAGYKGDDNALSVTAHWNLKNAKILYYLEQRIKSAIMSADEVLEELGKLAYGDYFLYKGDKVKALELLGKYHKLYTEKRELSGPGGGPIQIRTVLPRPEQTEQEED